jgi:hypothetical protein
MKKQFLPILLAAAYMQADFVTSNNKKAFGYTDGQVIIRPRSGLSGEGTYVRILGDAGSEKLFAFSYEKSGEHTFVPKSRLTDANNGGYDSRWGSLFEETVDASGLSTKDVIYGGVTYKVLTEFNTNHRPSFEAFANGEFEKAYYPTTGGIIFIRPTLNVSGTLAPLSRSGELPRDANGNLKMYTETTAASADTTAKTGVAGWWAGRQTWEKGLIVAGILGLVVLALRKIKI